MPAVRRGTVTEDISGTIKAISGALEWKADKEGIARIPIGRVIRFPSRVCCSLIHAVSQMHNTAEELEKNISTFLPHIRHAIAAKEDVLSKKTCERFQAIAQSPALRNILFITANVPAVLHAYLSSMRGPGIPLLL